MKQNNSTLLVVAIIVTVLALVSLIATVGKIGALTGHATQDTGTANLTIVTQAELVFTTDVVNWGSGAVDTSATSATLDTDAGTVTDGNWTAISTPLVLQNNGNTNLSINLTADKDAAAFLGGTSPEFKLKVSDAEAGSCADNTGVAFSSFASIDTSQQLACAKMEFIDSKDSLDVDIKLVVPYNSLTGSQGSVITATGTVA